MGCPHYYNWCMSTTFPKRIKLHYFDPDTWLGHSMNIFSKTPWQVVVLIWLPQTLWLLGSAMGLGDIASGIPLFQQHITLSSYLLFLEPYQWVAAPPLENTKFAYWKEMVLGYLFFTFFEWACHKYLFHRMPSKPWHNYCHFMLHGAHHVAPLDTMRLVFPPFPCHILRYAFCLLGYLACRNVYAYHAWMFGVMGGYLSYDLMHYANHHANIPFLKPIKRHHLRHHFHGPNEEPCNFALSYVAMIWDALFQTGCPSRDQAKVE